MFGLVELLYGFYGYVSNVILVGKLIGILKGFRILGRIGSPKIFSIK